MLVLVCSVYRACTSIVTSDQDGKIIQGRNLDYNAPEFLKNLTMQVDFHKDGKVCLHVFLTMLFFV